MRRIIFTFALLATSVAAIQALAQETASSPSIPTPTRDSYLQYPAYPPAAIRTGATGHVRAEFNIEASGDVKDVTITSKGSSHFRKVVEKHLGALKFEVQADWAQRGGETARYSILYVFDIESKRTSCKTPEPASNRESVVIVCASMAPTR